MFVQLDILDYQISNVDDRRSFTIIEYNLANLGRDII